MPMERYADSFWLFAHDAGAHHQPKPLEWWNMPGRNTAGPAEAARYLGIRNCCRVVFSGSPTPPFDAATAELKELRQVIWSIMGDGSSVRNDDGGDDFEEVLRMAKRFPNVVGGILDDFFRTQGDARIPLERLKEMARRMHEASPRPLKLWVVYYAALFGTDYHEYLDTIDGITFWCWDSKELADVEAGLLRLAEMAPSKERYAGCYLYNYGDKRPLSDEEMLGQLEIYRRLWLDRTIDGVVCCANTAVGTGLRSPDILREHIARYGELTRE